MDSINTNDNQETNSKEPDNVRETLTVSDTAYENNSGMSGEPSAEKVYEAQPYAPHNYNGYTAFQESVLQEKRKSYVPIILLLIFIIIMIAALTVYCIFTDIQMGSVEFNKRNGAENKNFALEILDKPNDGKNAEYKDENGKYTTEGIAEYVIPQVVEIITQCSSRQNELISSGSGIIISQDGYIVTNTHILDGGLTPAMLEEKAYVADKFTVITHDNKQYDAQVVGRDTKTDIAVLKIEASGLSAAEFGDSDKAVIGEKVAAVGNPEGLSGSVTDGIISGLNRKIRTDTTGYEMDCIQTNAAISHGNSGGALVNMYGQVIGITSSKYSNTDSEGLGFAITSNEAKPIIDELISNGYISGRIKLGITFYSMDNDVVTAEFKKKYNRDIPENLKGLWITNISSDCDIAKTELKIDDFILSVNGTKVLNYDDLSNVIEGKKAGDTLKAECARIDEDANISYFEIEFKVMQDKSGNF